VSAVVLAVTLLWNLFGKVYSLLAGWMPEAVFWSVAGLLSVVLVPIILYAGIAEVLNVRE
jgi:hypothetical protein